MRHFLLFVKQCFAVHDLPFSGLCVRVVLVEVIEVKQKQVLSDRKSVV